MLSLAIILEYLEQYAPLSLAAEWDNVGLLLGDRGAPIKRVMTCLTVTPETAAEAVAESAHLIVTHHPILFRPTQRLTSATPEGRMLLELAKAGVAVYSPHTAYDNAADGINTLLAQRLGMQDVGALRQREDAPQVKIVVFVPDADLTRVSDALFTAGAGEIGQYSQCSFRLAGTGTFFGGDAANPTIGQKGRREEVAEWRLEVVCPAQKTEATLSALRNAHSYEEPAFDVYPLRPRVAALGEGRIGRLGQSLPLAEFGQTVKTALRSGPVQIIGDLDRQVERIAIVCGAGGDLLKDAVRAGVDVFVTGEMRFHDYLGAQAAGLALVLPGHYATERGGVEVLAEHLQARWPELLVWASRREGDPVSWI
jgi:dinuclear metal center YbgI/SA1388 family protein